MPTDRPSRRTLALSVKPGDRFVNHCVTAGASPADRLRRLTSSAEEVMAGKHHHHDPRGGRDTQPEPHPSPICHQRHVRRSPRRHRPKPLSIPVDIPTVSKPDGYRRARSTLQIVIPAQQCIQAKSAHHQRRNEDRKQGGDRNVGRKRWAGS